MLRLAAYLLVTQFIFSIGIKVYSVIDWKINQDIITAKYCENKDKPMLNCNGQCYLSKQLEKLELQEKQERQEYPNPADQLEKTTFNWIVVNDNLQVMLTGSENSATRGGQLSTLISTEHYSVPEHPPKV
jgi:hypothetical protein